VISQGFNGKAVITRPFTLWKKLILLEAPQLFSGKKANSCKNEEELTSPLYEEIGRLKMDIKWLKKKL